MAFKRLPMATLGGKLGKQGEGQGYVSLLENHPVKNSISFYGAQCVLRTQFFVSATFNLHEIWGFLCEPHQKNCPDRRRWSEKRPPLPSFFCFNDVFHVLGFPRFPTSRFKFWKLSKTWRPNLWTLLEARIFQRANPILLEAIRKASIPSDLDEKTR